MIAVLFEAETRPADAATAKRLGSENARLPGRQRHRCRQAYPAVLVPAGYHLNIYQPAACGRFASSYAVCAASTASILFSTQWASTDTVSVRVRPSGVRLYSTATGTV